MFPKSTSNDTWIKKDEEMINIKSLNKCKYIWDE